MNSILCLENRKYDVFFDAIFLHKSGEQPACWDVQDGAPFLRDAIIMFYEHKLKVVVLFAYLNHHYVLYVVEGFSLLVQHRLQLLEYTGEDVHRIGMLGLVNVYQRLSNALV